MTIRRAWVVGLITLAGCADERFNTQVDASADGGVMPPDGGAADAPALDGAAGDGGLAPGTIRCGASTCRPPNEACCVPGDADAGSLVAIITNKDAKCVPFEQCLLPSVSVRCNLPSFCDSQTKGTVCCLNSANSRFTTTECVLPANCDISGPHDVLCDPAVNTCPVAASKCSAATFNGVHFDAFGICQ